MKTTAVSWLATIGIGITTAIVGLLVAGWFANKAVSWYNVPSREGASGYFVIFQALFGGIAGLVIGIIVSRVVNGMADASAARAFMFAQLAVILTVSVVATIARLLAHVPPTIGGDKLMMAVEFSWPAASAPTFPPFHAPADTTPSENSVNAAGDAVGRPIPHVVLFSTVGGGPYYGKQGPLWTDKLRHEGDRVIVPALVEIYTSRGQRLLQMHLTNDSTEASEIVVVPLRAFPRKSDLQWSNWLPTSTTPGAPMYRYRAARRSEVARTDTVGPFTIESRVTSFQLQAYDYRDPAMTSKATFTVLHNGKPITNEVIPGVALHGDPSPNGTQPFEEINAVASIEGNTNALVLQIDELYGPGSYCLLHLKGSVPVCEYMGAGMFRTLAHELKPTTPTTAFTARSIPVLQGQFVPSAFTASSLYLFPECALDGRTLRIQPVERDTYQNDLSSTPPVGLAPDASKLARIVGDQSNPVLRIVSVTTGQHTEMKLLGAPAPSGQWSDVNQSWFDNYFRWERAANGEYEVTRSPNALAMVRRGRLKQEPGYREYNISPVDSAMRDVVVAALVSEMSGVRQPTAKDDFSHQVKVGDVIVYVSFHDNSVGVWMDRGTNTLPVATFARKFDTLLATRRYDSHFLKEELQQ